MMKEEYHFFQIYYKKTFFLMLFVGMLVGLFVYLLGWHFEEFIQNTADQIAGSLEGSSGIVPTAFQDFLSIIKNNLMVGIMIIACGFIPFFGLPFLYGVTIFAAIGVIASFGTIMGFQIGKIMLISFVPHAVIEVIPICYSVAIGMYVNKNMVRKLFVRHKPTATINIVSLYALRSYLLVVVPFFLLAAFVEAYITQLLSEIFL